jgi:multiple sugar transport system substrate-binding protein
MTTIDFSFILDAESDYQVIVDLMSIFKRETGVDVNLKRMEWGDAWSQLIGIATRGHGADISYVGSTWVSSLTNMNALRPIPNHLVSKVGGEQAFVHSTWTSVLAEDHHAYGIPLSAYVYIVAYRKDLLEKTGLNSNAAFATPHALEETIKCLDELHEVENAWLMPIVPHPFNDLVHMAASWVWSSGGHMMDNRGKQVLFNSPAALAGLSSFLKLMRRVPNVDFLGADQCMDALIAGKTAAIITDARSLNRAIHNNATDIDKIGAASLMSIPWSGGGSVVVWRHTYGYPDKLEASYKLLDFLTRKSTMLELATSSYILPARTDALDELFPPDHILRPVMLQLISTGRAYRPIALWHRIEYQLGVELGAVAKQIMDDPSIDLDAAITQAMSGLTERLNLTLG